MLCINTVLFLPGRWFSKYQVRSMGSHTILLVLLLCFLQLWNYGLGSSWTLSKEEKIELERQLKLLNKPSIKTILNNFGDMYDCVDYNKLPASDHLLLKNIASQFQSKSTTSKHKSETDSSNIRKSISIKTNGEECPLGTVPVRRTTKLDLIRGRLALKTKPLETVNGSGILMALGRTKSGSDIYSGAASHISIHNPKVSGKQYTAARIKLQNGDESIEAGWRVDPTLYGDTKTRFYIKTKASETHCFNTLCPGFIMVSTGFPLDYIFENISEPGQPAFEIPVFMHTGPHGNWLLHVGVGLYYIGYWPSHIFKNLSRFANYIEWGGEVYSPPGMVGPQMGAGTFPGKDPKYAAYFSSIMEVTDKDKFTHAEDLEIYSDNSTIYSSVDQGFTGGEYGHLVLYGGPGNSK